MKVYSHLVFDIDGTLIDTVKIHMVSLEKTLRRYWGEDAKLPDLKFTFGIPGKAAMEALKLPDPEEAYREWEREYLACAEKSRGPLFPGIKEALDKIRKTKASLGIITSKTRDEYEEDFRGRGLKQYFSCVVTSSDTKRGKPSPEPMLEYLKRTGAEPGEVLYLGDSVHDMECARAAGVDHALVLWGSLMPEGIEADYRLERPEEIPGFVKECRG